MFVYRLLVIITSECIIMCADQILFRPERVRARARVRAGKKGTHHIQPGEYQINLYKEVSDQKFVYPKLGNLIH